MAKPYNIEEFLLRCKAILRRAGMGVKIQTAGLSALALDTVKQKAYLNGIYRRGIV